VTRQQRAKNAEKLNQTERACGPHDISFCVPQNRFEYLFER
jgi:hypothetical protein